MSTGYSGQVVASSQGEGRAGLCFDFAYLRSYTHTVLFWCGLLMYSSTT